MQVLQHAIPGTRIRSPESSLLIVGEVFEGRARPYIEHFGKRGYFGGARFATVTGKLGLALYLAIVAYKLWRFGCSFKYLTKREATTGMQCVTRAVVTGRSE